LDNTELADADDAEVGQEKEETKVQPNNFTGNFKLA
jgi:hypothetical protein